MKKKNILVVDDEIGALTLLGIMLERHGYNVIKANHGETALALLEVNKPDLIILDIMMPDIDGFELCSMLRQRLDTKDTPILILSARNDTDSVARGLKAGANDYLSKPIMNFDMAAKVRMMLSLSENPSE